jgi:hypothetical protein
MENDKVLFLAEAYSVQLAEAHEGTDVSSVRNQEADTRYSRLCHLYWMCTEIPGFVREGRIEKAMRWLGFIQGSMWVLEIRTIEEMKNDNMPADEKFDKERV